MWAGVQQGLDYYGIQSVHALQVQPWEPAISHQDPLLWPLIGLLHAQYYTFTFPQLDKYLW